MKMKEEAEFECANVLVMRKYQEGKKKFVCSVNNNEKYVTGSMVLAKEWFYKTLRGVSY